MPDDAQAIRDDEMPLPFGVRAATGEPLSGLKVEALAIGVRSEGGHGSLAAEEASGRGRIVKDPNDLKQAGWGVVLPGDVPSEVMTALKPLLELREQQAGSSVQGVG